MSIFLLRLRIFLEQRVGLLLLAGFALGLSVPGLEKIPVASLQVAVAFSIFCACARVEAKAFRTVSPKRLIRLYLIRFLFLPTLLFVMAQGMMPSYADGIFLLSVAPSGISSPGLTMLFGGNVVLAIALLILSTLLSPLIIPALFTLIAGGDISIAATALFQTLALLVFVPIGSDRVVAALLPELRGIVRHWAAALSVLVMSFICVVVAATQRDFVLQRSGELLLMLPLVSLLYVIYYIVGWIALGRHETITNRLTAMLCSGANNGALAIGLATTHFPPTTVLFAVLSEVPWTLGVVLFLRLVNRNRGTRISSS